MRAKAWRRGLLLPDALSANHAMVVDGIFGSFTKRIRLRRGLTGMI